MFLSDADIIKAIDSGELFIDPFCDGNIRPGSICLHLSDCFFELNKEDGIVDVYDSVSYPSPKRVEPTSDGSFVISPLSFWIGSTREKIGISNSLIGSLSNISGLARLGLNVLFSTHVAPGFGFCSQKFITLEIFNASKYPIKLHSGMRICHLTLATLINSANEGYDDKFPLKYTDHDAFGSEYCK